MICVIQLGRWVHLTNHSCLKEIIVLVEAVVQLGVNSHMSVLILVLILLVSMLVFFFFLLTSYFQHFYDSRPPPLPSIF